MNVCKRLRSSRLIIIPMTITLSVGKSLTHYCPACFADRGSGGNSVYGMVVGEGGVGGSVAQYSKPNDSIAFFNPSKTAIFCCCFFKSGKSCYLKKNNHVFLLMIYRESALIQKMAWRRDGTKPYSEPRLVLTCSCRIIRSFKG